MTQLITTTRSILVNETLAEVFDLVLKYNDFDSFIELTEMVPYPDCEGYWKRNIHINVNHIVEIRIS